MALKFVTLSRMARSLGQVGKPRIGYIGWTGHDNLGDEAMYQAAIVLMSRYSIYPWHRESRKNPLTRGLEMLGGFKAGCLGGGTLIYSGLGNLKSMQVALEHGWPVFTLGCGAGTVEGVTDPRHDIPRHRACWNEILKQCCGISVRGPLSLALMQEQGFENTKLVGDLALYLGKAVLPIKAEQPVLGINVGVMVKEDQGKDVLEKLLSIITHYRQKGWKIRLYCIWPKDLPCCEELAQKAGMDVGSIESHYIDGMQFIRSVQSCRVFIGMKLHAVVLACCGRVPAVMMEYRPKCRDFMLSMGLERFNRKLADLEIDWLIEAIDELDTNRDRYTEQIDSSISGYVKALECFYDDIAVQFLR